MNLKVNKKLVGIILIIVIVVIIIIAAWVVVTYNGLIAKRENAVSQWQQVENQYQRKIDLIPSLINITEQYTEFEQETLAKIVELRSLWLNASGIEQRINYSEQIDQTMVGVRVTYEAYPYLQSIQLVAGLMDELAGTENRVTVERLRYNEDARDYNIKVQSFPDSMIAGSYSFNKLPYFDPFPGGPGG